MMPGDHDTPITIGDGLTTQEPATEDHPEEVAADLDPSHDTPILLLIVLLLLFGGLGGGYVGWSHYGAPGGLGAALLVILVCYLIARRLEL